MIRHRCLIAIVALGLVVMADTAFADISLDFVTVGNPGNVADDTGFGSVDHVYRIGTYEVTAGDYTTFLNAVAASDPYGLYNPEMWSHDYGCKIQRSGTSDSFTYSVAADRANRPVNLVSWGDASRYMNWLHNGQGGGSTETGAYSLHGATTSAELMMVTRNVDARFWVPTEDKWYKAAYHKNDGLTGNYFEYPTSSDSVPSNALVDPDPGNNANFLVGAEYAIGSPYYMTEVGEFENSLSPYGTLDQGGNVWEWIETAVTDSTRGLRGGSWLFDSDRMKASFLRGNNDPAGEYYGVGIRVASVPEPSTITLWLLAGILGVGVVWRQRKAA